MQLYCIVMLFDLVKILTKCINIQIVKGMKFSWNFQLCFRFQVGALSRLVV